MGTEFLSGVMIMFWNYIGVMVVRSWTILKKHVRVPEQLNRLGVCLPVRS